MAEKSKTTSGVQELISKLRADGVKAGEEKAKQRIQEAEKKAANLLAQARTEAEQLTKKAHQEIEAEREAAAEALQVAIRDAVLKLQEEIRTRFAAHVKRLVSAELADEYFLKQVIIAVAGRAAPDLKPKESIEIMLAENWFAENGGSKTKGAGTKTPADPFILTVTSDMLREGFEIKPGGAHKQGVRLRLVGKDMQIDLSDEALSDLILSYLVPRFRAIAEGSEK